MANNAEVILKDGESSESLIRRFKKKVTKEKIMDEIRERAFYTKKSDIKREKRKLRKFMIDKENEKGRENDN